MSSDFTGIDGDTFDTGDERVRLIGVDTPEIGYNGEPDEPGAQKAKRVTQRFLDKNDVTLGRPATLHTRRLTGPLLSGVCFMRSQPKVKTLARNSSAKV